MASEMSRNLRASIFVQTNRFDSATISRSRNVYLSICTLIAFVFVDRPRRTALLDPEDA